MCDAWTTRVRRPERTDFVHIHTSRVFFAAVMDARADSSALLASLTSPALGSSVDARAENRRLVQEALAMDSSGSETGTPPPVVRHAVVEHKH